MKKTHNINCTLISLKSIFLGVLLCIFFMPSYAQCPDFLNLNSPNITFYTGRCGSSSSPFGSQSSTPVSNRHTIITSSGNDPYCPVPMVPPGETRSIRLGNSNTGCEAEAIEYSFIVDADNPVLLLKFALVMEDPGHSGPSQPRFIVRVLDANGNLVDPCAEYDVHIPGPEEPDYHIPGFIRMSGRSGYYRPWNNVGIDLTQ